MKKKRRAEAKQARMRIDRLKKLFFVVSPGCSDADAARFLRIHDMVFQSHSYRTHVSYLEKRLEVPAVYGPDRAYSESGMHGRAGKPGAGVDRVVTLMRMQAGKNGDADGPLSGDASGFSQMTYGDRGDAKKKIASRCKFDKLHILMAPHGIVVVCEAAPGGAHDPPAFRTMSGAPQKAAATSCRMRHALPGEGDCEMIAQSGRIPVIRPHHTPAQRDSAP